MKFKNATDAFDYYYEEISNRGTDQTDTLVLYNRGFTIMNPMDNIITTPFRCFNTKYAEREWVWYESENPDGTNIAKHAPIWLNHMDKLGDVRSNYGHQLARNRQLDKVIDILKKNPTSRQAVVSIYDGKEIDTYKYDTPCTLALHFQVYGGALNMSVMMRSNDLWFGFCNDQYCFSKIQEKVANELGLPIGHYAHFASNLHIYKNKLNR